jgi:hypothetical protein
MDRAEISSASYRSTNFEGLAAVYALLLWKPDCPLPADASERLATTERDAGTVPGAAELTRATGLAAPGIVPRSNGRSGGSGTLLASAPEPVGWVARAGTE